MSGSYATSLPVPIDADDLEVKRVRAEAVAQWFARVQGRALTPSADPEAELVDGDVVKVDGRVAISRSWRVWGPVSTVDPTRPSC